MQYKLKWKNGTTEIIEGVNIIVALNQAGYDDIHYLDALVGYGEIVLPNKQDKISETIFSCSTCKGNPVLYRSNIKGKYRIKCSDCDKTCDDDYDTEIDAYINWNNMQLSFI